VTLDVGVAEPAASDERKRVTDVVGLAKVLYRSWWIFVPGLLLTLGLAWVLPSVNHRAYQARASLFLVDPTTANPNTGVATNPYLNGNNSLVTTAGLLATTLQSEAEDMHADGEMTSVVDVTVSEKPPEPLLYLVVTGVSADQAERDTATMIDLGQRRLQEVQSGGSVGSDHFVTTLSVERSAPRQAETSRVRPALGIVFLGLGLTVWFVLVFDRSRWGRHRVRPSHVALTGTAD
jgi:hypothetical protein